MGITEFIKPSNLRIKKKYPYIFLSKVEFTADENAMFEKLRTAMGLKAELAPLFVGDYDSELSEQIEAKKYIQFEMLEDITKLENILIIPHPKLMNQKPDLKKPVWEELKRLVAKNV